MDSTSMTPADFSAMMGNNDNGFGGNGAWWIIILFLFLMGGNGWNNNRNSDFSQYATAASQNEILFGQQFNRLESKADGIANGISSLGYDQLGQMNNINQNILTQANGLQMNLGAAITTEGRTLQSQIAESCCNNRLATAQLAAQMDQQTGALTNAIHAEGEQTRALIQSNEIQSLRDKVSALEADNRMAGVVRYPMSYAYSAGQSPFCSCNCNSNI